MSFIRSRHLAASAFVVGAIAAAGCGSATNHVFGSGIEDAGSDQSAGATGGSSTGAGTAGTTGAGDTGNTGSTGRSTGTDGSPDASIGGDTSGSSDAGTADAGEGGMGQCGDGKLDPGEQCDDGNTTNRDGCENDCSFSCTKDEDCTLADPCMGTSTCDATTHACTTPEPLADGTTCTNGVCNAGLCTPMTCGNGTVDSGEECDDGNQTNGDGCESNCKFSCVSSDATRNCKQTNPCLTSSCDDNTHTCATPTPVADNTSCGTTSYCSNGACTQSRCGNSKVEPGEECDDGNGMGADGCENNCVFSCHSNDDCKLSDPCKGTSTCDPNVHTCTTPTPLPDNTSCGTGMTCKGGLCSTASCGDGHTDPGEECDDGNTNNGDGCESNCKFTCLSTDNTRNCSSVSQINPCKTSTCDDNTHLCSVPANVADNTVCGSHNYCLGGSCVPATCGNGKVEPTEVCDDGHVTACGTCNDTCSGQGTGSKCGDGVVCPDTETCDDGYVDACGDCNATCTGPGDPNHPDHVDCGCKGGTAPTELLTFTFCPSCSGQFCLCNPAAVYAAGCGGSVAWSDASSLCAQGCRLARFGDIPPTAHVPKNDYWVGDTVYYAGTATNSCSVTSPAASGFTQCSSIIKTLAAPLATPGGSAEAAVTGSIILPSNSNMLLCGSADTFGNTCTWSGCSRAPTPPVPPAQGASTSGPWGGCATTAGAVCICD